MADPSDTLQAANKLADGGNLGAGGGGTEAFFRSNPGAATALSMGVAAVPAAALLMRGNSGVPYQGPMQGLATQASSAYGQTGGAASSLMDPIISGKLPPGAQAAVDNAKKKADATVKGRYANLGLTGSTMEADQLAQNDQNVAQMQFEIEQQMFKSGIEAGRLALDQLKLQDAIYHDLMKAQMDQDKGMTDAIGGFAKAAGSAIGMAGGFAVGGPAGAMIGGSIGSYAGQGATLADSGGSGSSVADYAGAGAGVG